MNETLFYNGKSIITEANLHACRLTTSYTWHNINIRLNQKRVRKKKYIYAQENTQTSNAREREREGAYCGSNNLKFKST